MSHFSPYVIPEHEVELIAIRAQGPGGQNVNKVSNAVQLRFDIAASSLPQDVKDRLLTWRDQRITKEGVIVIKAQQSRSLEKNKAEALRRLQELIDSASHVPVVRRATKPTLAARQRRRELKNLRGQVKALRGKLHSTEGY